MTARFSELLPRAVDELEERWRARVYSALQVRDYCSKLMGRMKKVDQPFQPRIDALLEQARRDPSVIAFDVEELIENHEEGDNYRDTLEGAYNMLDRTATVPKQHTRVMRLIAKVVVEARREAVKSRVIGEYLGDWIAPATWAKAGVEIPGDKPVAKPKKKSPKPKRR